jgi:hypothetical protein
MKLFLKILKIFSIFIFSLSILLAGSAMLLQDKVAIIILNTLNQNISTKLDVGSFRLSFLKRFPKASLELKNVLIHSSSTFNKKDFPGHNTDTLLSAKNLSVEFSITDIINGNYDINSIGARSGKINLLVDSVGNINYDISSKNYEPDSGNTTINLRKIILNNFLIHYSNAATSLYISGLAKNETIKSRISGENIDFTTEADLIIYRFHLFNLNITKAIPSRINLSLQSNKDGIRFKKGSLNIDNYQFGVTGTISAQENLNLNITGNNINISKVLRYFPDQYYNMIPDYNPSGILNIECRLNGPVTRTSNPHIEITSNLKKGQISYNKSNLKITDLSFEGHFSNGKRNKPETSTVTINNFKGKLGSSEYSGSIVVSDLCHPKTDLSLKGKVYPLDIKEFFNIQYITIAEGSADIDLKILTDFWPKENIKLENIIYMKPMAKVVFDKFSIGLKDINIPIRNITGNLSVSETIKTEDFDFDFEDQKLNITGEFQNLPEWLAGNKVPLYIKADLKAGKILPEAFLNSKIDVTSGETRKRVTAFPDDVFLDINFVIDSLRYKTFSSSDIEGTLTYRPKAITFKTLKLHSLHGLIEGDGLVEQNNNKSIVFKGSYNIENIDIRKTFTSFHNFGQDFIKAENLEGTLSGNLSLLLPLDSLFNPQVPSLTAEGKYILTDGELINFEPVKHLSKFIELSELENISFQKLENDFFIKDNYLYLPQMEVRSSAVDLSVNGKHGFNDDYEYHLKVLLSELLSKKRKKNKTSSANTEFGVVEDDGLGRTSMLIKIENKDGNFKIGYDIKAAGNEIKNKIKTEKQTLKTIFKEEYGWYKNDSSIQQKPQGKKPRFKIITEDSDNENTTPTLPPAEKKKSKVNILFDNN